MFVFTKFNMYKLIQKALWQRQRAFCNIFLS
nr:MAG TPA: hypothetical protein [Caudoviricetes sp.]